MSSTAFAVKTNSYLEELIEKTDKIYGKDKSPIAIQFRHSDKEYNELPEEKLDYLGEDCRSYCDGLITQKYPDRMLLYVSDTCAALCRHCTRKRKVHDRKTLSITKDKLEQIYEYIIENPIRDVLISGGDPFMLPIDSLIAIANYVRLAFNKKEIKGVIRIGTRVPITNPSISRKIRQSDLYKLHKLGIEYINVQYNSHEELTKESLAQIHKFRNCGFSINNQSVLLKGVNDSVEALTKLNIKLYENGIRPYYLYSCDLIPGMSHFRVSIKRGIQLYEQLRGNISGLSIPLFIADLPDGMGKTPINPLYYKELENGIYEFHNYQGRTFIYKDREVTLNEY